MKYMGSKNRIAKYILPIILKDRKPDQWYVEPFVGGANMIDKVDGKRIGSDYNEYTILALNLIKNNPNLIPDIITENMYQEMKNKRNKDELTGFTSFAMSFGGKFFGGYRRDVAGTKGCDKNMFLQTQRSKKSAIIQSKKLKTVELIHSTYHELTIPVNSIIYCDPPYANTTKYKDKFDHDKFWDWCREQKILGHQIFISEYNAPDDFICLWEKEIVSSLTKDTGSKKGVERLFTL